MLLFISLSIGLNAMLVLRTIFSFGKIWKSVLTSTLYAVLSMLVGYYTATLNGIPLYMKIIITIATASIGIYFGKLFDIKMQKKRVFKYEINVKTNKQKENLCNDLQTMPNISYNIMQTSNGIQINAFETAKFSHLDKYLSQKKQKFIQIA